MEITSIFSTNDNESDLKEYKILKYDFNENSNVEDIIFHYEVQNEKAYQYYATLWRNIDIKKDDNDKKEKYFDFLCAFYINTHHNIQEECLENIEHLYHLKKENGQDSDENIDKVDSVKFELKMIYSEYWPLNAIRLKAYVDRNVNYYTNGQLANFEYFLRNIYRQKILNQNMEVSFADTSYKQDILVYRDIYFVDRNISSDFYLQVEPAPKSFNFENQTHIIYQAKEDASTYMNEPNYSFFLSFQAHFNKQISDYALRVKHEIYTLDSKALKQMLLEAKLNEKNYVDKYKELFNLYVGNYEYTRSQFIRLTGNYTQVHSLPKLNEYSVNTFFDEVTDTFKETLLSSIDDLVTRSIEYYKKTSSDEFIINIENQIRNYYQEQLSSLYIKTKNIIKKSDIQKYEIPILEEYKEKIDEYRNACMQKIDYIFDKDYPPINKYVDYSFSLGKEFQGLDKRMVIEWAIEAGKNNDLSLHFINIIRLKTEEFININCMHGDAVSKEEEMGAHEINVIMERFAMIEQRLLSFGQRMIEYYLLYISRYYQGEKSNEEWKAFEAKYNELLNQPLTTYYDTTFDIAKVQQQAQDDKTHYDSGDATSFFTKMKNTTQQKIYDVNDKYLQEIEEAKTSYIETGRRKALNLVLQNYRTDIDRLIDEYLTIAQYYIQEFENNEIDIVDDFDKGKYYYFQNDEEGNIK
jgi:hypothetical protein